MRLLACAHQEAKSVCDSELVMTKVGPVDDSDTV